MICCPCSGVMTVLKRNKIALAMLAFFVFAPAMACADDESIAIALVKRVYLAANTRSLDVLREAIDSSAIARKVLGNYWASASTNEQQDFTDSLTEVIAGALVRRFSGHTPDALMVLGARTLADGDVVVSSKMTWSESSLTVLDWRIHLCGDAACIVDVVADGVSLAIQRRDEYIARIEANGGSVADLIASLRQTASVSKKQ
jgi:ABC-type transporter MlaC component